MTGSAYPALAIGLSRTYHERDVGGLHRLPAVRTDNGILRLSHHAHLRFCVASAPLPNARRTHPERGALRRASLGLTRATSFHKTVRDRKSFPEFHPRSARHKNGIPRGYLCPARDH